MFIDRLWILGPPSTQMENVVKLLEAAEERYLFSQRRTPGSGLWVRVFNEQEAFSQNAYGVIGNLWPSHVYFVECAKRLLPDNGLVPSTSFGGLSFDILVSAELEKIARGKAHLK